MIQFLATLEQIAHSESVNTFDGVWRHMKWQMRRLLNAFPCELRISRSKLRVDDASGVGALVNAMGEYDYNNMQFARECLRRWGGTFVDVGANVGAYTLIAAEIQSARVLSLEAHPGTFWRLLENVDRNGCTNVTCVNVAVSDREGQLLISDGLESSLNFVVKDSAPVNSLQVMSQRLDTLFSKFALQPVLIKIDVEGYELPVLRGLGEFSSFPKAIFVEGGERTEIRAWMADAGFTGPWFVHCRGRQLDRRQQRRREDPVYIHGRCLTEGIQDRIAFGELLGSGEAQCTEPSVCR